MMTREPQTDDTLISAIRRTVLFSGVIIGVLFVVFVLWSVWVALPQSVIAQGTIESAVPNIQVRNADARTIAEVQVAEGTKVSRGQVLLTMDVSEERLRRDHVKRSLVSLRLKALRLKSELVTRSDMQIPAQLARDVAELEMLDIQKREKALLDLSLEEWRQTNAILRARAEGLSATNARLLERLGFESEQVLKAETVAQSFEQLRAGGRIKATDLERVQRIFLGLQASAAETQADLARTQLALTDVGHELAQLPIQRRIELMAQLSEIERLIARHQLELTEYDRRIELAHIRSPIAGTVFNLRHVSLGVIVPQFETLLEIVPDQSEVLAALKIAPDHIERLYIGDTVDVAVQAHSAADPQRIQGTVTRISADTIPGIGDRPDHYLAHLRLRAAGSGEGEGESTSTASFDLRPGMSIRANISTGEQTLAQILFGPIQRTIEHALTD